MNTIEYKFVGMKFFSFFFWSFLQQNIYHIWMICYLPYKIKKNLKNCGAQD